jgi:site-specific recombinase XerD
MNRAFESDTSSQSATNAASETRRIANRRSINKAPVTRHNYYGIVKGFFKWCHEKEEFIARNPMIKVDEPKVERQEPAVLTPQQMKTCLEAAMDESVALLAT